jgi:hypothetical protein
MTNLQSAPGEASATPARRPARSHVPAPGRGRGWWIAGLGITAVVVMVAAIFASADPDGLERVAENLGFIEAAQDAPYEIIPDYALPGVEDPAIATILAGFIGVAIVFGLMLALGRVLARRRA